MNRDTKIQKLREAIAAQTVSYPTISQAEVIYDAVFDEPEYEYGTARAVTDGWERGDSFGEHQYIDSRSVTDRLNYDPSTVTKARDMSRAVRRRKAGEWEKIS